MALHEVVLSQNAIDVAISCEGHIAVLHTNAVSLYNWDSRAKHTAPPTLKREIPIPDLPSYMCSQQVCCLNNNRVIVLQSGSMLREFSPEGEIHENLKKLFIDEPIQRITTLTSAGAHQALCILLQSNKLMIQRFDGPDMNTADDAAEVLVTSLAVSTPWLEVVELPNKGLYNGDETGLEPSAYVAFGLSKNGCLYANERLLTRNCTSFLVTPAHLVFTTSQHLLKFVHMTDVDGEHSLILLQYTADKSSIALEVPPDSPETDERCRSIERGARLVTVIPSVSALVLQMPRGNLETIYPRALVLAAIRENIAAKQYKKAFLACRNHRVDMNILHDHNPQQFMSSVGLFVDQVKKAEYIDLFLSQLRYAVLPLWPWILLRR